MENGRIVADHIRQSRIGLAPAVEVVRKAVPPGWPKHRRMSPRVQDGAAGIVERQAETETQAFTDFRNPLFDLLRRKKVGAPELIVSPEIAPGRTLGATVPPRRLFGVALHASACHAAKDRVADRRSRK